MRVTRTWAALVAGPVTTQLKVPVFDTIVRNWYVLPPSRDSSICADQKVDRLLVQVIASDVPV